MSNTTTPYTYFIHWSTLNISYFGRRTANGCNPNDLWVTYFTSSKYVHEFRKLHGEPDIIHVCSTFKNKKSCIEQETIVLHAVNAARDPLWLNRSNGDLTFNTSDMSNAIDVVTGEKLGLVHISDPRWLEGTIVHHLKGRTQTPESNKKRSERQKGISKPHTPEHGKAISTAKKGCKAHNKGVPHSEETKEKIRKKATGRISPIKGIPKTEEQKRKQSEAMKKRYLDKLRSAEGESSPTKSATF